MSHFMCNCRCEKTLEKLFEGAVVGSKVARMISGRSSDYGSSSSDNRAAMGFFLDRATRARLLLDGHRPQDVRMRSYRAEPIVVAAASGNAAAVTLLLRYGLAEESMRAAIAYLRDSATAPGARPCLDVLLRAVVCYGRRADHDDGGDVVWDPPALMHLARCAVRKALHDEFGLPHGIPRLPVPRSLVSYLDLEC
ncbi:SOCS box domain [Cinara cedri]|uniref:SOCS box domain n=1 Tax=Cinara cedri TaxID=506608 RepID=A0A5E4N169_9HEMI|nr:SOCS box domain [Cinara cedri]